MYNENGDRTMDALKQAALRLQLAKPLAAGIPSKSAPAVVAELDARFSALDRKLDTLIQMLQSPDGEPGPPQYLLTTDVRRALTQHFNVTEQEIDRAGGNTKITRIRQIGYHLCRMYTTRSLTEIGRIFGGREHTTVHYGVRKIGKARKADAALNEDLLALEARLADLLARRCSE
jgi:chromosomal replication initiation ATPase DnaA